MSRGATRTLSRVWIPFVGLAFSGMAGLVYEVVWSRAMAALFGSVLTATGTLLALFMGGLGLGSALGARWAARVRRPLVAFGVVELAIGCLALTTPYMLRAVAPLVAAVDVRLPDGLAPTVPALASLVLLGPVVVLMGVTFPLFLAHVAHDRGTVSADSGRVYGVNTAGAVAGTLVAGFALLPVLGIERSLVLAAGIDLAVGAACVLVGWRIEFQPVDADGVEESSDGGSWERLAVVVALLGGAAALILEVAWFRSLMLIIGSSVYALSLMLAAFLVGLVSGAMLLARRGDRAANAAGVLGRYHVLIAFTATMVTLVVQVVPALYIPLLGASRGSFTVVAVGTTLILLGFLLVPTTLMGASLPLAMRMAATRAPGRAARPAGRVYAASSIGSSLGALAAGFVLVPRFGLRGAVFAAVLLSLVAAVLAGRAAADRGLRRFGVQAGALTLGLWLVWALGLFPWDWRILTAGYYAYAHLYSNHRVAAPGPTRRQVALTGPFAFASGDDPGEPFPGQGASGPQDRARLLSWEEGAFAQVAVVEEGGLRSLLINGKADASNGAGDMRTQLLLGHLPVLLAPDDPGGAAMVIGLGSGVTAGAVASWPFASITVAEIEPAVARASRWFSAENRDVLADPRVRLRIDDARRVLERSAGRLEVLTSEPSNLWMSGVSLLFTHEFFELAAQRLGTRGVLCQWLHLYQVGPDDVRTLLNTMGGPFPHMVAVADGSDLLVVASRSPLVLDPEVWQRRLAARPEAAATLARAGIGSALDLAGAVVADERGIRRWAVGAPLHTDDRPILEFSAARRMASDYSAPILAALVAAGADAGPIPLGTAGWVGDPVR